MHRLRLASGLIAIGLSCAAARSHAAECSLAYPFVSDEPRTSVAFHEAAVLRGFSPERTITAAPGTTIKVWYNDEHALLLGVRQVRVKTAAGTTTTDYPVSAMTANPDAAIAPQVGTTALDGDQAGTDTASCDGFADRCDRPLFPALFLTDITADADNRAGDWQYGGAPIPPHAVFGTWKAAVRIVDKTKSPAKVSVVPDGNPVKNHWNLGAGAAAPAGLEDEGYGAEVRWSVDQLVAAGRMVLGHSYRVQFMVHDGDQGGKGGDVGEACVDVVLPACVTAADCDDQNACTTETCVAGVCHRSTAAACTPCDSPEDCDDGDACTRETCAGGICGGSRLSGCMPCAVAAACDDRDACTVERCDAGVCAHDTMDGCVSCATAGDCNDGNGCTDDACMEGRCRFEPMPGCLTCRTAADCDDRNACTTERCDDGVCGEVAIADCTPCIVNADCNDGSACTTDTCERGACNHAFEQDCVPCTAPSHCDDRNACTTDTCADGVCAHEAVPECVACTTAADCRDDDACTNEGCVAGVCRTLHLFDCARPAEVCGDCVDNDDDGLTDFEDPACCLQLHTMGLFRGRIVPRGTGASGLRLRTELACSGGAAIDPLAQDVFLQVRAEGGRGDLLCARIPAGKFMWMRRAYRFWDRSRAVASAKGLQDMTVKVGRRGRIRFKTHGPEVEMLDAGQGRLRVTVAMYGAGGTGPENTCWSSMVPFRASRRGKLLTP